MNGAVYKTNKQNVVQISQWKCAYHLQFFAVILELWSAKLLSVSFDKLEVFELIVNGQSERNGEPVCPCKR